MEHDPSVLFGTQMKVKVNFTVATETRKNTEILRASQCFSG